jgi:putative ABC transport system ATP-binding protein
MLIEMKDICKDYLQGREMVPVLRDVNLQVEEGDYLAIMGPSGSGKTTLMNILGYLDVPTRGEYLFDGQSYQGASDNALAAVRNRQIGFVFQNFYLLAKLSALENVALPLLYAGVSKKERLARAAEALEMVGLAERKTFFSNQLSGGQCQRVAIARAMVARPKLLLADEPTGALDTASGAQIMEIFKTLNQNGTSIVMITHEPEIAKCARRISYIRDGVLSDKRKEGVGL